MHATLKSQLTSDDHHDCAEDDLDEELKFVMVAGEAEKKIVVQWRLQKVHGDIKLDHICGKNGICIVQFHD